jgi:hypothetical protein
MSEFLEVFTRLSEKIEEHGASCDDFCGDYTSQLDALSFVARQVLTPDEFAQFYLGATNGDADAAYAVYNRNGVVHGRVQWYGGVYYLEDPSVPSALVNE